MPLKEGHPDRRIWDETPPGHENKQTARRKIRLREVAAVLEERGLEPIGAICDVLPELDPSMKVRTLLALAEFVHPKQARTVVTGPDNGPIQHGVTLNIVGVPPVA